MKTLTLSDLQIELIAEYEIIPVKGNAIASDDDAYDAKIEQEIIDRLESGDVWAWASVEVKATYKGLTASNYLGCCSYTNEAEFKEEGGYYDDMCQTVLDDINKQIADLCIVDNQTVYYVHSFDFANIAEFETDGQIDADKVKTHPAVNESKLSDFIHDLNYQNIDNYSVFAI